MFCFIHEPFVCRVIYTSMVMRRPLDHSAAKNRLVVLYASSQIVFNFLPDELHCMYMLHVLPFA